MTQEEPREEYKDAPQDRNVQVIWSVVIGVVLLATLSVLIVLGYIYQWEWVGVGEAYRPKPTDQDIRRQKTLWDWLQLLIIPVAVAIGTFVLDQTAKRRDNKAQEEQKEREEAIENQRAQDGALQSYLDQMSTLLIDADRAERLYNLDDKQGYKLRVLARARTLTALGQLDRTRQGSVIRFLYEAELLDKNYPAVRLRLADLRKADLSKAYLSGANLSEVDLRGADLREADLREANLSEADLRGADLREADLREANLSKADVRGADLREANLSGATDLVGADLREADLSKAYLRGIDLERSGSLEKAILKRADLKPYITKFSVDKEDPTKGMHNGEWERSIAGFEIASTIGDDKISHGSVYVITDLSFAKLKGADLEGADLRFVRLHETKLQDVNLARSDLRGATDSKRSIERESYLPRNPGSLVKNEWLERQARSIEGAIMPDAPNITNSQHRNDS